MDLTSGCPYWPLSSGLGLVVPPLDRDRTVDVAIIGGGISGALLCDSLIAAGLEVIVLDRRHIGRGSTSASTALLQYEIDTPLHRLRRKIATAHADRAYTLGVEAIDELAALAARVGVRADRTPSLYVSRSADSATDLRRELEARRSIGLDVRWVEPEELLARHGVSAAGAIRSAVGASVDPFLLCHALLNDAILRGASVHDRTSVMEIQPQRAKVVLQTDRGPRITARHAIHASGYEATKWLPRKIASLHSTYAFISEPLENAPAIPEPCMVWEYADAYFYARWCGDRLLVGGGDTPFRHAHTRERLVEKKTRELQQRAHEFLPALHAEPAFSWGGTFASTKDGLAYIGPHKRTDRVLYALGFGGNGITYSVISRRILVDFILGRANPDATIFRFDR